MKTTKHIAKKEYAPFDRPRLASWFPEEKPRWIRFEPAPIAAFCAACFSTIALLVQLIRQLLGTPLTPTNVIVSVALTFVVSYTLVGIFVYYLLCVAAREIWREEELAAALEEKPIDNQHISEVVGDKGEI